MYEKPSHDGDMDMGAVAPNVLQNVPDEVVEYLRVFRVAVEEQNVPLIHNLYEYGFPELSDKYYRERYWPDGEKVAEIVGAEAKDVFVILYKELYYRYLYAKMQRGPSLEHRYYSYFNYQDFFMFVLTEEKPQELNLPNQWLWDIIDEFVYQFQSFCQYKANPSKRTPEELKDLAHVEKDIWNLYPVLNILYQLIKRSQINEQLEALNQKRNPEEFCTEFGRHPLYFKLGYFSLIGLLRLQTMLGDYHEALKCVVLGNPEEFCTEFGRHPLYFKLGYFSLIGLLRLQTMLGDYHEALKCVKNIEFEPKGLYNRVPNCLVTVHYFVGYCRMIMGQYSDATRIFVNCMLFIQRTRNILQQQPRATYQYDIISKTNDQLYHLLAICLALQPQRTDESIMQHLTERLGDKWARLQRGELPEFESTFMAGCPKFLNPILTNFEGGNFGKEPTQQQCRLFMDDVKQQIAIPALRGYLKLYSTMSISKLASFMEGSEMELICDLLAFKHKMAISSRDQNVEEEVVPDIDFYVDKDMIHIAGTTIERRHCEYFIKQILKCSELTNNLQKLKG